MPKTPIIDLKKRKLMKEAALEKAEELLMHIMHNAKSAELNDYIMQSDLLRKTAEVFYEFDVRKDASDNDGAGE